MRSPEVVLPVRTLRKACHGIVRYAPRVMIGTTDSSERYLDLVGYRAVQIALLFRDMMAFALITLGVMLTKFGVSRKVVHPMIFAQIRQAGLRLLPMLIFLGVTFGLVIIGQTVALLSRVGAGELIGTVMVTVVMRELGPLLTAIVVLARAGTSNVVELGTMRAMGEVSALESLGIDPVHYLVMPRMLGLAVSVLCLATYFVLAAILSGWVCAFLQDVPLRPAAYFGRLGDALHWQDFVLFGLKTMLFGVVIAVVSCYHGLARPLRFEEISSVTERAVVEGVIGCVLLDALFLVGYVFI
jgi:phospholipid/cholesterol/gamma-HCH transport system permease protein